MGKVYLVGAGPGDPELITMKGRKRLEECDVIIYDRLASEELLRSVKKDCIKVYVGKQKGHHSVSQEEINQIILEYGKTYDQVVRLKGGDSFVFGRGGEEIECLLQHHIPFEVIPGISSAIAVPEVAGIPVTHRGVSQSFHVITGHRVNGKEIPSEQYEVLAKLEGTLVFLMGLSHIETIVDNLIHYGMKGDTPVGVISNGTTWKEKVVRATLNTIVNLIQETPLESPGIIVVGNTAACQYRWLEEKQAGILAEKSAAVKPVGKSAGKSVGIIGTEKIMNKLSHQLKRYDYKPIELLKLQVVKTKEYKELFGGYLNDLGSYQWIVFTSQNGVHIFFEGMNDNQIDRRKLSKVKFAVIGTGTKEALGQYGYFADYMPDTYTSKELGKGLCEIVSEGEKVLLPRARQGRDDITHLLKSKGIDIFDLPIYDVVGEEASSIHQDQLDGLDIFTFASASGVDAFFSLLEEKRLTIQKDQVIACIGNVTAEELDKFQRSANIVSRVNDMSGLVEMIKAYDEKRKGISR